MLETELKITVQAKYHLYIHRRIENPAQHLKCSKKEFLAKIILVWNLRQGSKYARDREGSA